VRILAIDSSGPACSAALWQDGVIVSQTVLQNGNTHSVNLMPIIEGVLEGADVKPDGLDYIACVTGPGSFTGVRIGVSCARALSFATGKPCIPVNALEALARIPFNGAVCPILDARRSQVYCAAFKDGARLLPDAALDIGAFLDQVYGLGAPCLFVGDGVGVHREQIVRRMEGKARIASENMSFLSAASAAVLAAQRIDLAVARGELAPYYLRAPQAEREYAQKHGDA